MDKVKQQKYYLKELRMRKKMTQKEVADELGISVQTYSSWEKDITNVAVKRVEALAKYYGCSIDELNFKYVD